jgi:predicted regulator of Ras-like GTPase activity (Roadblock/LC7/MglB family)
MSEERRQKRSDKHDQALGYWLEAVSRRNNVDDMVLADESGFVIAANNKTDLAEEAAAMAPTFTAAHRTGRLSTMQVDAMSLDGMPAYLCALGNSAAACASSIEEARPGIQRIMG